MKVFLRYPEALRPAFPRLKEKLEDPDPGVQVVKTLHSTLYTLHLPVQSAAVNVICELARKNPKNYLSLAPTFFKLMTSSTNNWMLIKIIKLFGALTPLEPRSEHWCEPLGCSKIHNFLEKALSDSPSATLRPLYKSTICRKKNHHDIPF